MNELFPSHKLVNVYSAEIIFKPYLTPKTLNLESKVYVFLRNFK